MNNQNIGNAEAVELLDTQYGANDGTRRVFRYRTQSKLGSSGLEEVFQLLHSVILPLGVLFGAEKWEGFGWLKIPVALWLAFGAIGTISSTYQSSLDRARRRAAGETIIVDDDGITFESTRDYKSCRWAEVIEMRSASGRRLFAGPAIWHILYREDYIEVSETLPEFDVLQQLVEQAVGTGEPDGAVEA